jgi:hypothetical protein
VQVVDGEYYDLATALQLVEQVQQPGTHGHRVGSGLRRTPWEQLVDDTVRERCLCLVTTNFEHHRARKRTEEA